MYRSLLRSVVILLALGMVSGAAPTITILHTNDFHQNLDRLPKIAGYAEQYKKKNPQTVFIDAGDWFDRGSSLPLITRGEAIYGAMATMGYDMWILGNHDWAYGGARLRQLMDKYPIPVLGTNLGTSQSSLPANVVPLLVKELAGIRVGFLGITLDTYGKNPKHRPYFHVFDARESTARGIRTLKEQNVDIIVAVTHLGFKRMKHESKRKCPADLDLAREFPDIDVIVGGHSHSSLDKKQVLAVYEETKTIVVQAGASGRYIGKLVLEISPETRKIINFDTELVPFTKMTTKYPATAAFLDAQFAAHMPNAKQVVGTLEEGMERHNAGAWYADLIRAQTGADLVLLPVNAFYKEPKAFRKGPMTVERLYGYFYDKYLVEKQVSGKDLSAYLQSPKIIHRLNPLHDRGHPYSEDAIYTSGFEPEFNPETQKVILNLDPAKTYTLVTPWFHSWKHLLEGEEHGLPPRNLAEQKANPLPGLPSSKQRLLEKTSMNLMLSKAIDRGLSFHREYPEIPKNWLLWKAHYESLRKK